MYYAKWNEPKQHRMGFSGSERTPIYAGCADCGTPDVVIAGDMRSESGIGVIVKDGQYGMKEYHQAVFCTPCFTVRWDALMPPIIEPSYTPIPRATYAEVAAMGWFESPDA